MNRRVRYAFFAVITIGVLLILVSAFSAPLIYSLETDLSGTSRYHQNVDALRIQSLNSTTEIGPELQELIDFSGPVSLTIEIHDFEDARRYLDRFGESRASVRNLIVKLDMEDSEIAELEQNAGLQKQILESLLNTSVSLDALQSMEIQYYSESTQEMRTPFRMRGDELRKKVKDLNERYRNATKKVEKIGTKLGLDVKKNTESANRVDTIVRNIEKPDTTDTSTGGTDNSSSTTSGGGEPGTPGSNNTSGNVGTNSSDRITNKSSGSANTSAGAPPSQTVPAATPAGTTMPKPGAVNSSSGEATPRPLQNPVSLTVQPETGRFRDTITYSGLSLTPLGNTTPREETSPVTVYVDDKPVFSVATDRYGFYSARIPVENLTPGNHTIYSRSPTSRSENRTLTVSSADSSTYLVAGSPDVEGKVVFEGYVESDEAPVVSAPVRIGWDQSRCITTTTDEDGYFREMIQFPPGRHIIVANFSGTGYPLNPSESSPLVVDISYLRSPGAGPGMVWVIIAVTGIGIIVLIAVKVYLRRMRTDRSRQNGAPDRSGDSPTSASGPPPQSAASGRIHQNDTKKVYEGESLAARYRTGLKEGDPGVPARDTGQQSPVRLSTDVYLGQNISVPMGAISQTSQNSRYGTTLTAESSNRPSDLYHQQWADNRPDYANDEPLITWYRRLIHEDGLQGASRRAYQYLAGRISRDLHIREYKSLTARELSGNCRKKPYCQPFSRFVSVYEQIRYGGTDSDEDSENLGTALITTDDKVTDESR